MEGLLRPALPDRLMNDRALAKADTKPLNLANCLGGRRDLLRRSPGGGSHGECEN